MKKLALMIALLAPAAALGQAATDTARILKSVYGATPGCVYVGDIDEGEADRTAQLTAGKLYSVFCYDSATFEGVACRVKQGGSTVDASSGEGATGEGELLFAGEKTMVLVTSGMDYISFEPLADGTTQIGVACPRN